jgi:hypothetical protein
MGLLQKMLETSEQQGGQVHVQAQKSSPNEIYFRQSAFTVPAWTYQLFADFFSIHPSSIRLKWGHKPN